MTSGDANAVAKATSAASTSAGNFRKIPACVPAATAPAQSVSATARVMGTSG